MNISSIFDSTKNYPNPLYPITKIEYTIPQDGQVKIEIVDSENNIVATLLNKFQKTGSYEILFSLWAISKAGLPRGIYYFRLSSDNFSDLKKIILK